MESTVIRDQDIRYERRASGYLTTTFDEKQRKARVSVDVYSPSLILFGCFNAAFHHHSFIHSFIHSSLITKYRNSFHIYLPLNSETSLIAESLNVYSQQNSLMNKTFFKLAHCTTVVVNRVVSTIIGHQELLILTLHLVLKGYSDLYSSYSEPECTRRVFSSAFSRRSMMVIGCVMKLSLVMRQLIMAMIMEARSRGRRLFF